MTPGPDQIVACPHCDGLARYATIMSGNTFGARVWTDGRQVAPMLPRPPAVVKCGQCAKCYWLRDAREVGTLSRWRDEDQATDPAWQNAEDVKEPSEEEYCAAIAGGLAMDADQERWARILAWWRGNDAFREGVNQQPVASGTRKENLEALLGLLEGADADRMMMKAEVLRQLGAFKPALELLGRVTQANYAGVVGQIRELCQRGETGVRQLKFN